VAPGVGEEEPCERELGHVAEVVSDDAAVRGFQVFEVLDHVPQRGGGGSLRGAYGVGHNEGGLRHGVQ
jgi:hypothetical protein